MCCVPVHGTCVWYLCVVPVCAACMAPVCGACMLPVWCLFAVALLTIVVSVHYTIGRLGINMSILQLTFYKLDHIYI